jgi:hypothetical protein
MLFSFRIRHSLQSYIQRSYIHVYSLHSAAYFTDTTSDSSWFLHSGLGIVYDKCCGYFLNRGAVGKWANIGRGVSRVEKDGGFSGAGTSLGTGSGEGASRTGSGAGAGGTGPGDGGSGAVGGGLAVLLARSKMWLRASEKVLMLMAGMAVKAVRVTGDRGQHSKDMQERGGKMYLYQPLLVPQQFGLALMLGGLSG